MRRTRLFASVLVSLLGVASVAYASDYFSAAGQRFDVQDGLSPSFSTSGAMSDGTSDSYDNCYSLDVGSFFYDGRTAATRSVDGRQSDLPPVDSGAGFTVERHIYVPATGPSYARYIDVLRSTGGPITTTVRISGNLGSDGSTVLVATSSGDLTIGTDDSWFVSDDSLDGSGDPSLAHVFQGPGGLVTASAIASTGGGNDNVSYSYEVEIPAGGVVAIMHFAVQERDRATATATAAYIAELPDDVLNGADDFLPDVVNWPISGGACEGTPDGAACTSTRGDTGTCHAGRCCTGCWDGAACRSGRSPTACAAGGAACVRCAAVAFCESNACEGGVCVGSPCDDGETCTTDTCDEAADRCDHVVTSGCIVGGECVTEGDHHVAYPCLVCDSSRNATDWSPVESGSSCGADRCSMGRRFEGGTCDGAGECVAPSVELCATLTCADSAACAEPCTETSCGPGERCAESRLCEPLRGLGDECTIDAQCAMGSCVDGVCCQSACDGTCESCNLPGSDGVCTAIPAGTDPYEECSGSRVCGAERTCVAAPRDSGVIEEDAAMVDAGETDAATRPDAGPIEEGRGCSCSAAGASSSTGNAGLGLLAIGLVALARRRRR